MLLEEIMQLSMLSKEQLIQLCNALYKIVLEGGTKVEVINPQPFTTSYVPQIPYVPMNPPLPNAEPWKITFGDVPNTNTNEITCNQ